MSIGQATPRIEGPSKVRGEARYAADVYPDRTLFAVIVGSPVAAGRVVRVDATVSDAADRPR